MSKSPLLSQDTDRTSLEVKVDGQVLKSKYAVISVEVVQNINKLPYAYVEVMDGSPSEQKYENLDELNIKTGSELEIAVGYKEKNEPIFKGIVVSVGTSGSPDDHGRIKIEATDACHKMTLNRKSRFFEKKKDHEIVKKIVGEYSGIKVKTDNTPTKHEKIAQYAATDWDFILSRASVCERIIVAEENKLNFVKPGGDSVAKIEFGLDIIDFDINVDARHQSKSIKVKGWNPSEHKFKTGTSKEPSYIEKQGGGDVKGSRLASTLDYEEEVLYTSTPMDTDELKDFATSKLLFSRLSKIKGSFKFQGYGKVKINSFLDIKKVHKNYDGKAYVSGVKHIQKQGNFVTEVKVGIDHDAIVNKPSGTSMPDNFGAMPGIKGLVIGTVTKMHGDPGSDFRVQVKIPMVSESDDGIWARLTNPYGGKKGGFIWYPEIGDQVIVGFLMNDPRFGIILGSLYSKKFSPSSDFEPAANNYKKAIVTRSQMVMSFDDQHSNFQLKTPGGHCFDIKDQGKKIRLEDSHGNFLEMSNKGIEISSIKDIKIKADRGKININAMSDLTGDAMNIKLTGKTGIKATGGNTGKLSLSAGSSNLEGLSTKVEGSVSASVKSSGFLTLKGSMVMIN